MNDATNSLSVKSLLNEVRQEFGSPDRGFLRTAWTMATAPGTTLRAIFRGERDELTRPVRYFLLVFTLYGLVYVSTGAIGIIAADTTQNLADNVNAALAAHGAVARVTAAEIAKANPLTYYLQYPLVFEIVDTILLWIASWIALARMGLNATERLGATMYLYGTFNLLQIPLVLFVFTGHIQALFFVLNIVFMAYLAWATHGLAETPRKTTFLRGIAWWVILQLLSGAIVGSAMLKYGYDLGNHATHPVPAA